MDPRVTTDDVRWAENRGSPPAGERTCHVTDRVRRRAEGILALGVFSTACLFAVTLLPRYPGVFFHDDSFFYLKIASNLASGQGSTFDGVNPTNGYHPLYLALLTAVSRVWPLLGLRGIVAVFLLDMALLGIAILVWGRLLQRAGWETPYRVLAIVTIIGAVGFNDFGMEVRLLLPAAWFFFACAVSFNQARASYLLTLGLLAAITCLARLDAIVPVSTVALCLALRVSLTSGLRRLGALARILGFVLVPSLLVLGGYALANAIRFGHASTVSAWLKAGWPGTFQTHWFENSGLKIQLRMLFCALMAVCYLVPYGWKWATSRPQAGHADPFRFPDLLFALNVGNLIYLAVLLLYSHGGVLGWYFALPLSVAVMTGVSVFRALAKKRIPAPGAGLCLEPWAVTGMLTVVVAAAGVFIGSKVIRYDALRKDAVAMGLWMKENLPRNCRVFQVNGSGFTGYFSQRPVVNGDGLVNSWQYQEYLRSGRLIDYLREHDIQYLLWDGYHGQDSIQVRVPLWNRQAVVLSFSQPPEQIARSGRFVLLKPGLDHMVLDGGR